MEKKLFIFALILAIICGQIIKVPLTNSGGLILLDIVIIILSIYGSFKIKFKFKTFPQWVIFGFIFIIIALISLIITPLSLIPIEYYSSISYTIRLFFYISFGLILLNTKLLEPEDISKIFIFSGLILAVLGLSQLIFLPDLSFLLSEGWDPHYFRTVSTFLDPNFLGAYMSLTLIVLTQQITQSFKWKLLIFTLVFLALLTTFSRGAYLGFITGFLLLSLLNKSVRLFLLTLLLSLTLMSGFIFYQKYIAEPRNIDRTQSAEYRVNAWEQGLAIFQKHPILGVGFNSYRYALREYNLGTEQFLESRGASSNDASLLYLASTTGIVGLSIFLLFILSLILTARQNLVNHRVWGVTLLSGLTTISIQSFFSNTLFYPPLLIWIILSICANYSQVMVKPNKLFSRFFP